MGWSISRGGHITDMWTARHCNEDAKLIDHVFVCQVCGRQIEKHEAIGRFSRKHIQQVKEKRVEFAKNHALFVDSELKEMKSKSHKCPMCGAKIIDFEMGDDGISGTCHVCNSPFFIGID